MNILGHIHVALVADDDPAFLVGAVLPDLAPMARARVDRSRATGPLAHGVRAHLQADAAFHALPEFRRGTAAVRDDLVGEGMRRGSARAVAHAGLELLLDGTLVGSAAEQAFHRALGAAGDAAAAVVVPEHQARWLAFLGRWRALPAPELRYHEPAWVAERLHALLAARPRLGFPEDEIAVVRQVLAAHVPWVASRADGILAGVARTVHGVASVPRR